MNFFKSLFFAALFSLGSTALQADVIHLLPKPQKVTTQQGYFNTARAIDLQLPTLDAKGAAVQAELRQFITSLGGSVQSGAAARIQVQLVPSIAGAEFQADAYTLQIQPDAVSIQATTQEGAYYAVQTLWQLSEGLTQQLPTCSITDWSAWRIRGYMLDTGRSYMEVSTLKSLIAQLSRYKINTFHWHITDNQGWRLESKIYPQLNAASSFTRQAGKYYTIAEAQDIVSWAQQHGVTVIPEIDMPGHSEAFRKAMGHPMLTPEGLTEIKNIIKEATETFAASPWFHVGTDEVRGPDQGSISDAVFMPQIFDYVRSLGKKVVAWAPGHHGNAKPDMSHMWSSRGSATPGVPAIDSRYFYINHFDQYSDVVGTYRSNIAGERKQSDQYAGIIAGIWTDRQLENDTAILLQNAFFPSLLAIAERAWCGGGDAYITQGGNTLDPLNKDFNDWERRFLFHKAHFLKDAPIAYAKQTNIHWRITDPFPNGGNLASVFPPETQAPAKSYTYNGQTYNTAPATGGGIFLRHYWGSLIPTFYNNPQPNSTAYAYTYVYSPEAQTVGAQIEFQNYSKEADIAAPQGQWDYKQSRLWVNDKEIMPPTWLNTHQNNNMETPLRNENFTGRPPMPITLQKGWNKVFMKLPVGAFSTSPVRLIKWMFTFVLVTPDGKQEVPGLIYSPEQSMLPAKDLLQQAIERAEDFLSKAHFGSEPGRYGLAVQTTLRTYISTAQDLVKDTTLAEADYEQGMNTLLTALETAQKAINLPQVSTDQKQYWYTLSTPKRSPNLYITDKGVGQPLTGQGYTEQPTEAQLWKVVQNADGTYRLVNKETGAYLSANAASNTALTTATTEAISSQWQFLPITAEGLFAIAAGTVQLNQTGSGQGYKIYNWGNGNNLTDSGCLWLIKTARIDGADLRDSLIIMRDEALTLQMSVSPGTEPGYYDPAAVQAITTRVTQSNALLEDPSTTEASLRKALTDLKVATQALKEAIVLPIISSNDTIAWYALIAKRNNYAVTDQGVGQTLLGTTWDKTNEAQLWKFVRTQAGDVALVNKANNTYIIPSSGKLTTQSTPPNTSWGVTPIGRERLFTITSGTAQFNQGNAGTSFAINNWGNGTNQTDDGCLYTIVQHELILTAITAPTQQGQYVWVAQQRLQSTLPLASLRVYTASGHQLNPFAPLPQGIIIVHTPSGDVYKLPVTP